MQVQPRWADSKRQKEMQLLRLAGTVNTFHVRAGTTVKTKIGSGFPSQNTGTLASRRWKNRKLVECVHDYRVNLQSC
jgi:hypothetical protein